MKIRVKLTLSLIFLFGLILLLGSTGMIYLQRLAKDSEAIIQDNYRTLTYMQGMDNSLDQLQALLPLLNNDREVLKDIEETQRIFEENLEGQLKNVTEPAEQEFSFSLKEDYLKLSDRIMVFRGDPQSDFYINHLTPHIYRLEEQIERIYLLNGESILKKNEHAKTTAKQVTVYMFIVSGSAGMIGFLLILAIPAYVSRPVNRLNEAILQVSKGNYKHKLAVSGKNEFGRLAKSFNKMAAKLEEYEHSQFARLLYEKKRIEAIVNQMHDAIVGLDENKIVIFINQRALNLIGLRREEIIGRYAPDVSVNNQLMKDLISELMTGFDAWEEKKYRSVKIVESDRRKLFSKNIIDITSKPVGDEREILIGHVIILTDITEFADRDVAKTHFIATLSHELKTPVAAIEMSIDLLQKDEVGQLNEEQKKLTDTIAGNNHRMQQIIREVIDLSRVESGSIEISKERTDTRKAIEKAAKGVDLFLKNKNIRINLSIAGSLPAIMADPHKLIWVFTNFLTNAIRYSPREGEIMISANQQGGYVSIAVKDRGVGISKENQKRLFKKFSRVSEDTARGTGLGLVISKEFIEAMGGMIGVESVEGQGSTFWVRLPVSEQKLP